MQMLKKSPHHAVLPRDVALEITGSYFDQLYIVQPSGFIILEPFIFKETIIVA